MVASDIHYEIAGARAAAVGPAHGLTEPEWADLEAETARLVGRLNETRGETPYRDLPHNESLSQRERVKASAGAKAGRFDDVVILGIGGSALGLTALKTALCRPFWNVLPARRRDGRPRLWVLDNVDPGEVEALLNLVDHRRTLFNVISKSGSTAETMAQFLVVAELLRECLGGAWKDHVVVTTDARGGLLRPLADGEGLESFVVPDGVGGRLSKPIAAMRSAPCPTSDPALIASPSFSSACRYSPNVCHSQVTSGWSEMRPQSWRMSASCPSPTGAGDIPQLPRM